MKLRRQKDLNILKNPDLSFQEFNSWAQELFLGSEAEKFGIPENVLEFGLGVMEKNFRLAKDSNIRNLILRKILHTREVVEAGQEILELENEIVGNGAFGAVTFLHDMGRFSQAHLGSYSDAKTGFDHAEASAEMVSEAELGESVGGVEKERIVEAIRNHSKLAYDGNNLYGKFVRDADKLGLMEYFPYHIVEHKVPDGKVTPGALKVFLEGNQVLKKDMVNRIDVFLSWLSWAFDFNFSATKKLFKTTGIREYILDEIKKMDREIIGSIKGKLDQIN